ncbi:MAG: hypothetical protein ACQESN_01860 [Thermotogota bacterium]
MGVINIKNIYLVFILFIVLSNTIFSDQYLIQDYTENIENKFVFDFSIEDIYETSIKYNFLLEESTIKTSNIDEIINYFEFDQPGFNISYQKPKYIKDEMFILKNSNGFTITIDEYIYLTLRNLYTGIFFQNDNLISSFTFKIDDFSESYYSLGVKLNNSWISLQISDEKRIFVNYKNLYLNLLPIFDKIYIRSDEYILKYDDEKEDLYVDSIFFEKNNDSFYFRIPIEENIFIVYSSYGPGITFRIKI